MKTCPVCGAHNLSEQRVPIYEHLIMGVPVILVDSALASTCDQCGEARVVIPHQANLTASIGITRIMDPVRLAPADIKLLRKIAQWRAVDLAEKVGVRPETISRWESGAEPLSQQSEMYIRLRVAHALVASAPFYKDAITDIISMKLEPVRREPAQPMRFELVRVREDKKKKDIWDTADMVAA